MSQKIELPPQPLPRPLDEATMSAMKLYIEALGSWERVCKAIIEAEPRPSPGPEAGE
jgi:hypothetical protein